MIKRRLKAFALDYIIILGNILALYTVTIVASGTKVIYER